MSEEINKHEAERNGTLSQLNEAELTGVSGGYVHSDDIRKAQQHCYSCDRKHTVSIMTLAEYILDHGDFGSNTNCPYYNS